MRKQIIVFLLFLSAVCIAQELSIENNPYDDINNPILSESKAFQREKWFYEQRMYPFNYIPENAYQVAIEQRNFLRSINGFYSERSGTNFNFSNWTSIGPTPGYYFNYSDISSRMTTVAYDPIDPDIIYIGAAFGGLWKSTDGGNTFEAKTDDEVSLSSGSIAIDPNNTDILFYGTGEATYSGASYYGRGVLKSTDGGDTWNETSAGLPDLTYTSRLVIKPGDSNTLFAALGNSGLYKSTNAGNTWIQVLGGRCDDVIFSPSGNNVYIVGSGTGYKISTDGGNTFSSNNSLNMGDRNHIAICKSIPSVLYFAKYSSNGVDVFKSTDFGNSYTPAAPGTDFAGYQSWYNFYMHVNPHDPDYAYVGAIDIWRTTDGGTSFSNITNGYNGGYVHVDQHNMAFHPSDPNELFCVNDGGLWYSTDRGSNWENRNSSFTLTQFYRITSDPSSPVHVLGGTQDNGTQRTIGTLNWVAAFGGDGGEVCFHKIDNDYILGETQNNGIYRSTNGGTSWTYSTTGLFGNAAWVSPILSHPIQLGVFYTARQNVFISSDWGASWNALSANLGGTIREMAISSKGDLIYCTISSKIKRSTDGGVNFEDVTSGLPNRTITSVFIHPLNDNIAIITFSGFSTGKIFITTNKGDTWTDITGNLPDSPANDGIILAHDMSDTYFVVATDIGVFISENEGGDWIELASGLPNTVAIHLDYNEAADQLIVGTHGRGVFKAEDFIVPVELMGFDAELKNSKVILNWSTATETNNKSFEVERMINEDKHNNEWEKITSVPGKGTTSNISYYQFIDDLSDQSGGIIKYRLKQYDFDGSASIISETQINYLPDKFLLSQNFPNPFNPSTKIEYSVPSESLIRLSVFNSLGELVEVLNEEKHLPGSYEVEWDGTNFSSGIYFYRLDYINYKTNNSLIKKMLLLK